MPVPLTELRNGETGVIVSTELCPKKPFHPKIPSRPEIPFHKHGKHHHMGRRQFKTEPHHKWRLMTSRCLRRLTDLGLTPGTSVTVVKSAPFHGPLEINVRGSKLAIGRAMAKRILVEVKR